MSINLLPWREIAYKNRKKKLLIESVVCLLFFVLFIMISYLKNFTILEQQRQELAVIDHKMEKIAMNYAVALSQDKRLIDRDRKESFLKIKLNTHQGLLQMIEKTAEKMPDTVYLTAIKRKDGKINFQGKSPSHEELAKFLAQVKSVTNRQPMITETSTAEGGGGGISFEVLYEL